MPLNTMITKPTKIHGESLAHVSDGVALRTPRLNSRSSQNRRGPKNRQRPMTWIPSTQPQIYVDSRNDVLRSESWIVCNKFTNEDTLVPSLEPGSIHATSPSPIAHRVPVARHSTCARKGGPTGLLK